MQPLKIFHTGYRIHGNPTKRANTCWALAGPSRTQTELNPPANGPLGAKVTNGQPNEGKDKLMHKPGTQGECQAFACVFVFTWAQAQNPKRTHSLALQSWSNRLAPPSLADLGSRNLPI
jgi:hypothetical protein